MIQSGFIVGFVVFYANSFDNFASHDLLAATDIALAEGFLYTKLLILRREYGPSHLNHSWICTHFPDILNPFLVVCTMDTWDKIKDFLMHLEWFLSTEPNFWVKLPL